MIHVLQDGFLTFQNHFWLIICIYLVILWGQIVMQYMLSKIFANQFTEDEYFALSLSGWIFPVFVWAGIYFLLNILLGKIIAGIISTIIFIIPFFSIKFKKISPMIFYLSLFLLLSLFLRLALLEQAIFPSYFDSAEHYRVIQYFLSMYQNESWSVNWFMLNYNYYYHTGYHFLSATLIYLFRFNEISFMLVFGQILLALLPISFFFLLKQITGSNTIAFFTCLIAGFGFHMPAYLINWGKYPALLSLVGVQFVICLGYILIKYSVVQSSKSKLYLLVCLSVFITALIHTRTLIIFALVTVLFFVSYQTKKLSIRSQYLSLLLLFVFLGIEFFYIFQSPVLSLLLTGYTQRDLWSLILVLLLIPFSIKSFPNLTFFLLTILCLFMSLLFFPVSLFDYGTQTLLDRPFVQILAYFPLSIIIGLGFASLLFTLQQPPYIRSLINFVMFSFIFLNLNFNYNFYPSDCCQLVSRDDVSALSWIGNNLPDNTKVLIPSNRLYVTAYESTQTQAGVDAGIWITPLFGKDTILSSTETNFEIESVHMLLCSKSIQYIYIGSMPQSFNQISLASHPNWYDPVFLLPKTQVYELIGCQ